MALGIKEGASNPSRAWNKSYGRDQGEERQVRPLQGRSVGFSPRGGGAGIWHLGDTKVCRHPSSRAVVSSPNSTHCINLDQLDIVHLIHILSTVAFLPIGQKIQTLPSLALSLCFLPFIFRGSSPLPSKQSFLLHFHCLSHARKYRTPDRQNHIRDTIFRAGISLPNRSTCHQRTPAPRPTGPNRYEQLSGLAIP